MVRTAGAWPELPGTPVSAAIVAMVGAGSGRARSGRRLLVAVFRRRDDGGLKRRLIEAERRVAEIEASAELEIVRMRARAEREFAQVVKRAKREGVSRQDPAVGGRREQIRADAVQREVAIRAEAQRQIDLIKADVQAVQVRDVAAGDEP